MIVDEENRSIILEEGEGLPQEGDPPLPFTPKFIYLMGSPEGRYVLNVTYVWTPLEPSS